jgi:hypothetical protein
MKYGRKGKERRGRKGSYHLHVHLRDTACCRVSVGRTDFKSCGTDPGGG